MMDDYSLRQAAIKHAEENPDVLRGDIERIIEAERYANWCRIRDGMRALPSSLWQIKTVTPKQALRLQEMYR